MTSATLVKLRRDFTANEQVHGDHHQTSILKTNESWGIGNDWFASYKPDLPDNWSRFLKLLSSTTDYLRLVTIVALDKTPVFRLRANPRLHPIQAEGFFQRLRVSARAILHRDTTRLA